MTVLSDLENADTLQVSGIAWQLNPPVGSAQSGTAAGFCLTKASGVGLAGLAFTLNSSDLGFPVRFSLPFTGVANSDGTSITWTTDTTLTNVSYAGYTIKRVHGTLVTSLGAPPQPSLTSPCSGNPNQRPRLVTALLRASSTNQTLSIDVAITDAITVTATAAIQFVANAGEVVPVTYFTVGVSAAQWQTDGCNNRYQVYSPPSTPLQLTAFAENVQTTGNITSTLYQWPTIQGPARFIPPTDRSSVQISLTGPGQVVVGVTLSISTDLDSAGTAMGSFSFSVVTEQELELQREVCRLKNSLRFIPERTPVGDPALGDAAAVNIASRAITPTELAQLQTAAQHIADSAHTVVAQAGALAGAQKAR